MRSLEDQIARAVDELAGEMLDFARALIDIPTVNPPGRHYLECADLIAARLRQFNFDVSLIPSEGHRDHTAKHPRRNVIGTRRGSAARPMLHFNGHMDVVPPGNGWTRDPFRATVEAGRLYGRGSSDMKSGIASAIYAAEALRRAGASLRGSIQISATVDEESGGFAGVAYLAERGLLTARDIDYVIIPEPFGPSRICIGHRGVYWFRIVSHGKSAHGSMPYLGVNAIENMAALIVELETSLAPDIASRITAMPVVPDGSKRGTLNINSIKGGQADEDPQSPCVPDRCEVVCERRWIAEDGPGETGLDRVKTEIAAVLERVARERPGSHLELIDYGNTVFPASTPPDTEIVRVLSQAIREVMQREPELVASPGTYDHKHFSRIGKIVQCVAYGPGDLERAHQPGEWCHVESIVQSCKVMALTAARLIC